MSLAKRLKQMTTLKMATHSGTFQCDEALGVWMLRQLPKWRDAELVRSRDSAVLDAVTAEGGIVIDVGGRYDPDALRFDHHQRGFFETFNGVAIVEKPYKDSDLIEALAQAIGSSPAGAGQQSD